MSKYEEILKDFASTLNSEIKQQTNPLQVMFMAENALKGNFSQTDLTEVKGFYSGLKTAREILRRLLCTISEESDPEAESCVGCEFREICELMGIDTEGGE